MGLGSWRAAGALTATAADQVASGAVLLGGPRKPRAPDARSADGVGADGGRGGGRSASG